MMTARRGMADSGGGVVVEERRANVSVTFEHCASQFDGSAFGSTTKPVSKAARQADTPNVSQAERAACECGRSRKPRLASSLKSRTIFQPSPNLDFESSAARELSLPELVDKALSETFCKSGPTFDSGACKADRGLRRKRGSSRWPPPRSGAKFVPSRPPCVPSGRCLCSTRSGSSLTPIRSSSSVAPLPRRTLLGYYVEKLCRCPKVPWERTSW